METEKLAVTAFLQALVRDVRRSCSSSHSDQIFFTSFAYSVDKIIYHIEARGIRCLLVTLPDIGKVFDKGLSSRSFDWETYEGVCRRDCFSHKNLRWTFKSIFSGEDGRMWDDVTPEKIFFLRCLLNFFKKLEKDCPPNTVKEAVNDFIAIDSELREPSGSWFSDHWVPCSFRFGDVAFLKATHPRGRKLWSIVDDVFTAIVPMHQVDRLGIRPKHGPGAVADQQTGNDKYSFPHWPTKLESVFPATLYAMHREDLLFTEELTLTLSPKEPPARLIAVPKTFKGPRLIASEPIAHQFLQQGLMKWLRLNLSPLLGTTINFQSQEPSRAAALLASRRGDLATVDLSSASDRLSCWTVERAFKSNQDLLRCLHAVRTRIITDATGSVNDLSLRMKKFAAQGSAVTFPVQSIIYAGLAIAACLFDENLDPTRRNIRRVAGRIRVFGDDIVIPRRCVPVLALMLDSLQLKVNVHKTHHQGSFRESCGMDAWRGHNVTPLYIRNLGWTKSPEKIQSWIDVTNNAYKMGLWEVSTYMDSCIPVGIRNRMITSSEDGDGLRLFSFVRGFSTQAQTRWCDKHHVTKAKLLAIRNTALKKSRGSWQDFYQFLVEAPLPESKWKTGYIARKASRLCEVWVATE